MEHDHSSDLESISEEPPQCDWRVGFCGRSVELELRGVSEQLLVVPCLG
jgi:hypothetical protein